MLRIFQVKVAELTVDPAGTTLEQWVRRGQVWQNVGLEHGLDATLHVFVHTNDLIEAANRVQ